MVRGRRRNVSADVQSVFLSEHPICGGCSTHRTERHMTIHNDDIIYTPNIVVFKTDTDRPELMERDDWYIVDVITCAAPNLREKPSNRYNSGDGTRAVTPSNRELQVIHEKRLRRMLDSAVMNHADTVILGAFGCGAFVTNRRSWQLLRQMW